MRWLFALLCAACGGSVGASRDGGPAETSGAADAGLDADDPSCDCVAPPPDGFFYVGYAEGAPAPACPLGFIDPTDSIEASGDPATCSCSCNGVKDAYCIPKDVSISYGASCGALTAVAGGFGNSSCGMATVNASLASTVYASMSVTSFVAGGDCNTPTSVRDVPPLAQSPVRTCQPNEPYLGCTGGRSCVPKDTGAFAMCVQAYDPATPCPEGFPKRHEVGAHVHDQRGCSVCACEVLQAGHCTVTSAPVYGDANCNTSPAATLDETCQAVGASELDVQSFDANTRLDAAECSPFAGNSYPEGQITFDGAMTICCAL